MDMGTKKRYARRGQPTKYRPEYCERVVKYFQDAKPWRENEVVTEYKNGNTVTKTERVANPPPFLSRFAREELNVHRDTLYEWAEKHENFSDALKKCGLIVEEFLIENGLIGSYNPAFCIFTAKNLIGWRDRQDIAHSVDTSTARMLSSARNRDTGETQAAP